MAENPWSLALKPCSCNPKVPDFTDYRFCGLTWNSLRKHPNTLAMAGVLALTLGTAGFFSYHAALEPEVSFRRHANPEPWNEYRHKRYALFHVVDDVFPDSPAPEY